MQTTDLSEAAQIVLRSRIECGSREVTPENIEAYRELARAGIMYAVSGFLSGPEYLFRWTDQGWEQRYELSGATRPSLLSASPGESRERHH